MMTGNYQQPATLKNNKTQPGRDIISPAEQDALRLLPVV